MGCKKQTGGSLKTFFTTEFYNGEKNGETRGTLHLFFPFFYNKNYISLYCKILRCGTCKNERVAKTMFIFMRGYVV